MVKITQSKKLKGQLSPLVPIYIYTRFHDIVVIYTTYLEIRERFEGTTLYVLFCRYLSQSRRL